MRPFLQNQKNPETEIFEFCVKFIYSEKTTNVLRNFHRRFVLCSNGQIYGGDFVKFCGLLRMYEL